MAGIDYFAMLDHHTANVEAAVLTTFGLGLSVALYLLPGSRAYKRIYMSIALSTVVFYGFGSLLKPVVEQV